MGVDYDRAHVTFLLNLVDPDVPMLVNNFNRSLRWCMRNVLGPSDMMKLFFH